MAAATDLAPVYAPASWAAEPPCERPEATVVPLFAPADAPPLRLTRRGRRAVALLVAAVAVVLVGLAFRSAPAAPAARPAPAAVTVQPGDTLWSIAAAVAPQRDPRAEVVALQRLNHLSGVALVPGQVLRTR